MKFKLRWQNGFGYEDGTKVPYSYFLENKESGESIKLDTVKFESWLKESNHTTNDFRNHRQQELTQFLVDNLEMFK